MEHVDAVFAQILHHDVRSVVDRTRPSRAAQKLRDEINRSLAARPSAAAQGRGGQHVGASAEAGRPFGMEAEGDQRTSCRLLVQLEEVVDVALSNEARMQRDMRRGPASNTNSSALTSSSGSRCLKLQLADGYQHALQPRHNPTNTQARLLTSSAIVAMEMSPIPNLTDQTMAGTKLLLTLGDGEEVLTTSCSASSEPVLRISHGVLLLTPHNCLVVGGHVPELAAEQARQRKAVQDQSGASIADPTIRALVSHNYMTDANADDDDDDDNGTLGRCRGAESGAFLLYPVSSPFVQPFVSSG
jgi:hypothetical protein